MPSYDPDEMKAQANLALEKVKLIIDLAKKDVDKAEEMFSEGEDSVILLRSMQSRLQSIYKKLLKYQKEFTAVKVKGEDYTATTIASDAVEVDLEGLITKCEQSVEQLMIQDQQIAVPANQEAKLVKMTASPFPEFDGSQDLDIYERTWKVLGDNSGLEQAGLLIKLRESITGKARDYIGTSGMSTLTYNQLWEKLRQRYALPWKKT